MIKENILLVGGGGHCKSVIEAIESANQWKIAGIVDVPEKVGGNILGYPVVGTDKELEDLLKSTPNVCITIGQLRDGQKRSELFVSLKALGAQMPVIVASSARVSKHATIGEGTVILHHALVNPGAIVGKNCIINTSAIVEHDSKVGNHCHISTGAIVNGGCEIGDLVLIGSNAVLKHGIKLQDKAIIGAGAVVVKDVERERTVYGNPAKLR